MEQLLKVVGAMEVLERGQEQGDVSNNNNNNNSQKKKKKKRPVPARAEALSPPPSVGDSGGLFPSRRSWFNVYDVFRCKQLHIHLSAVTMSTPRRTNAASNSKSLTEEHKPLHQNHCQAVGVSPAPKDVRKNTEQQRNRRSVELQRRMEMIQRLQSRDPEEQTLAAQEIRAAARKDSEARTALALMGAIPPLVTMLDSKNTSCSSAAIVALLNLAVRNDQNKAAIVAAGAVPRIIKFIQSSRHAQLHESSVAALLSLTALDSNKFLIAQSDGVPLALISSITDSESSQQARRDALGAVYNLSLCPGNAAVLCAAAAVAAVLSAVYEPELCSRAVATAANLVSTPTGRRAMSRVESSSLVFVDVLNWGRCGYPVGNSCSSQVERAVYVVMVLAECSPAQRRAMIRAGCSSVLLELVLVGSPLAQERASRTLQFLEDGFSDSSSSSYCCLLLQDEEEDDQQRSEEEHRELIEQELYSEERRAVNKLVQQSLKLNMQRITKRACIPFASPLVAPKG